MALVSLSDTKQPVTADHLACRAGLRTLMATGDYHHTALAVARAVGMVSAQGQVVIIQKDTKMPSFRAKPSVLKAEGAADRVSHRVLHARSLTPSSSSNSSNFQGLLFHMDTGSPTQHDALELLTAAAEVC